VEIFKIIASITNVNHGDLKCSVKEMERKRKRRLNVKKKQKQNGNKNK